MLPVTGPKHVHSKMGFFWVTCPCYLRRYVLHVSDPVWAMLCRAGRNHRLSTAPPSIDTLQEKDIEAILNIVCNDTSMPSIWGVNPSAAS